MGSSPQPSRLQIPIKLSEKVSLLLLAAVVLAFQVHFKLMKPVEPRPRYYNGMQLPPEYKPHGEVFPEFSFFLLDDPSQLHTLSGYNHEHPFLLLLFTDVLNPPKIGRSTREWMAERHMEVLVVTSETFDEAQQQILDGWLPRAPIAVETPIDPAWKIDGNSSLVVLNPSRRVIFRGKYIGEIFKVFHSHVRKSHKKK